MRLFIFGAGSTIGTLGLPGVKGFGRRLAHEMTRWRHELPVLASVVDALEPRDRRSPDDWDLDAAWTHVDYVAKLYPALDTSHYPGSASAELHAAVTKVYGSIDVVAVRCAYDLGQQFSLRHELDRVESGDVVVSFNWDILVECVLGHRFSKGAVRVAQAPHRPSGECVRFAKPHGSLTWNRYKLQPFHDGQGGPKVDGVPRWEEVVGSEKTLEYAFKVEPLLLGAVPIKSELIRGIDETQYALIMAQWATLCRALTCADEISVVGYGFPAEDAYGRFLMRQAIRRRPRRIAKVDLYELPERFEDTRGAICEVCGVSPNDIADRGRVTPFRCSDSPSA